jgi:hypothetical protein
LPSEGVLALGLPQTMLFVSVGAPVAQRIPSPEVEPRLPVMVQFTQVKPATLSSYTAPPYAALLPTNTALLMVMPPLVSATLRPPPREPVSARLPLKMRFWSTLALVPLCRLIPPPSPLAAMLSENVTVSAVTGLSE